MTGLAPALRGPRYHYLVRRLHRLGPRPVGELLVEVTPDQDDLLLRLEQMALWDQATIRWLGADDWHTLEPRAVS